jgi:hypothetical protein
MDAKSVCIINGVFHPAATLQGQQRLFRILDVWRFLFGSAGAELRWCGIIFLFFAKQHAP